MKPALQNSNWGNALPLNFPIEENCALIEIILWHGDAIHFHLDLDGTDQPPFIHTSLTFHAMSCPKVLSVVSVEPFTALCLRPSVRQTPMHHERSISFYIIRWRAHTHLSVNSPCQRANRTLQHVAPLHNACLYNAISDVKFFRAPRSSATRLSSTVAETLIPYSGVDISATAVSPCVIEPCVNAVG